LRDHHAPLHLGTTHPGLRQYRDGGACILLIRVEGAHTIGRRHRGRSICSSAVAAALVPLTPSSFQRKRQNPIRGMRPPAGRLSKLYVESLQRFSQYVNFQQSRRSSSADGKKGATPCPSNISRREFAPMDRYHNQGPRFPAIQSSGRRGGERRQVERRRR